jgi:hypothetical protein
MPTQIPPFASWESVASVTLLSGSIDYTYFVDNPGGDRAVLVFVHYDGVRPTISGPGGFVADAEAEGASTGVVTQSGRSVSITHSLKSSLWVGQPGTFTITGAVGRIYSHQIYRAECKPTLFGAQSPLVTDLASTANLTLNCPARAGAIALIPLTSIATSGWPPPYINPRTLSSAGTTLFTPQTILYGKLFPELSPGFQGDCTVTFSVQLFQALPGATQFTNTVNGHTGTAAGLISASLAGRIASYHPY